MGDAFEHLESDPEMENSNDPLEDQQNPSEIPTEAELDQPPPPAVLGENQEIAALSERNDNSEGKLQFGQTYLDYPTFQRALKDYEQEKFVLFSQRGSDKNHSDAPEISDKTLYPFKRLNLSCIHGMPIRQKGIGKRPNQQYNGKGCKARVRLTLVTQQGSKFYGKYRVTTFDDNHTNHDVDETSFKMHSRNRRLTPQQRDFYVKEMKVGMDAMNR